MLREPTPSHTLLQTLQITQATRFERLLWRIQPRQSSRLPLEPTQLRKAVLGQTLEQPLMAAKLLLFQAQ